MSDNKGSKDQKSDDILEMKLMQAWSQLDAWEDSKESSPGQDQIRWMLQQQRHRQKVGLWKDLSILWSVAIMLVIGGLVLINENVSSYMWIQVIFLIIGVSVVLKEYVWRSKVKEEEG